MFKKQYIYVEIYQVIVYELNFEGRDDDGSYIMETSVPLGIHILQFCLLNFDGLIYYVI